VSAGTPGRPHCARLATSVAARPPPALARLPEEGARTASLARRARHVLTAARL